MKKIITIFLCCFVLSSFVLAQENEIKIEQPNFNDLIVYKDKGLAHSFCDYQGNILSYTALNEKLLECPNNNQIVSEAKGWMIADGVFCGITLTSAVLYSLFTFFPQWDESGIVREVSCFTFCPSLLLQLLSGVVSSQKYHEACDNYNLYVLGIPIK